ncbi:hypothetical protein ABK040_008305 [Willaertia magna]
MLYSNNSNDRMNALVVSKSSSSSSSNSGSNHSSPLVIPTLFNHSPSIVNNNHHLNNGNCTATTVVAVSSNNVNCNYNYDNRKILNSTTLNSHHFVHNNNNQHPKQQYSNVNNVNYNTSVNNNNSSVILEQLKQSTGIEMITHYTIPSTPSHSSPSNSNSNNNEDNNSNSSISLSPRSNNSSNGSFGYQSVSSNNNSSTIYSNNNNTSSSSGGRNRSNSNGSNNTINSTMSFTKMLPKPIPSLQQPIVDDTIIEPDIDTPRRLQKIISTNIENKKKKNFTKMKSATLQNTFTQSKLEIKVKCNRTSQNQQTHLTYQDLKLYFNISENEAAKKLGISKSKLKRIKGKLNIERWPYRRIQSFEKKRMELITKISNVNNNELNSELNNDKEKNKIDKAINFIIDNPNIIIKYNNEDIIQIANRLDRIKIVNLIN